MFGDNIEFVPDHAPEDVLMEQPEAEDDADMPIDQNDSWVVIESYFATHNLVAQQINSFNHFIENKLQVGSAPASRVLPKAFAGSKLQRPDLTT